MTLTDPIIPGLYPDPSACRAGDTYYIVNSSFEYRPGLPIHASVDLVTWTPVGNALTRSTQFGDTAGAPGSGIYAPTIRFHNGRFWIACTNIDEIVDGLGHFIIVADDPAGPWSDPVHVRGAIGVDPDLAWDEDGTCHMTWSSYAPDLHGIVSVPIDPTTGQMLGRPRRLWQGIGGSSPEAPHLYRIDDWWYLLLAEGGTERGHMSTIARARSLDDDFEPAPLNPILSHRSTVEPVQSVGHGDLVQLVDGSWAMIHLGVRPGGKTPGFHGNGRETFAVGIDWKDGWPVVDEDRFAGDREDHSFEDTFSATELHGRWLAAGVFPTTFTSPAAEGGLVIDAAAVDDAPAMIVTRPRDSEWQAAATVDVDGVARMLLRIDDDHLCAVTFDGAMVEAAVKVGPATQVLGRAETSGATTLRIGVSLTEPGPWGRPAAPDLIHLGWIDADGVDHDLGSVDGRYLSVELAAAFTGRVVGIQSVVGTTTVRSFTYSTLAATTENS